MTTLNCTCSRNLGSHLNLMSKRKALYLLNYGSCLTQAHVLTWILSHDSLLLELCEPTRAQLFKSESSCTFSNNLGSHLPFLSFLKLKALVVVRLCSGCSLCHSRYNPPLSLSLCVCVCVCVCVC